MAKFAVNCFIIPIRHLPKIIAVFILVSLLSGIILLAQGASPFGRLNSPIENKEEAVKQEVDRLVQLNDIPSFTILSDGLSFFVDGPDIGIYWTFVCGMAAFTNEEVMSKTADFIVQHKDDKYGKSLLAAWRSNQTKAKLTLLKGIKDKLSGEMLEECIRQLDSNPAKIIDKDAKSIRAYRDLKVVQGLDKDKIIVVRNDLCDENIKKAGGKRYNGEPLFDGNYDNIQNVLTTLGIPYTLIGKSELEKDSFAWDSKWIIIFNCNMFREHCCNPEHLKPKDGELHPYRPGEDNHSVHDTKVSEKCINKIRQFTENGGFLLTEDLNIDEIIERAFKVTITHTKFLLEKSVKIAPYPVEVLHPYLKYVFEMPPIELPITQTMVGDFNLNAHWLIDDESPDIKVLKKDKVTILITSPELARSQKNEGAVAVTFSVPNSEDKNKQGGQVLHIMSHFTKQSEKINEFTMQNLLVNFLEDCAARHQVQPVKKE